jgi:hypothetical protein
MDDIVKSLGIIKRGELLIFTAGLVDTATGNAATGLAGRISCHGKYSADGPVIVTLIVTETEIPGTYMFKSDSPVSWMDGLVLFDIKYDIPGVTPIHTETFSVTVEGAITE